MKKLLLALAVSALCGACAVDSRGAGLQACAIAQAPRRRDAALPSFAEPGISPDGSRSRSSAAATSGKCRRAAAMRGCSCRIRRPNRGRCSRPTARASPSPRRAPATATSTCSTLATGDVTRLTFDDAQRAGDGWSARRPVGATSSRAATRSPACSTSTASSADGGTPMPVAAIATRPSTSPRRRRAATRSRSPRAATPGRSGGARATAISTRARSGSSTAPGRPRPARATSRSPRAARRTRGRCGRPAARALYFMSDRSGAQNIWSVSSLGVRARPAGAKAVTTFTDGRVLWPSISKDGRTIAFERDFGIWTRRHRDRAGARGADRAARRAGGDRRRAPHVHRSASGAGAVARRQEGRVRGARRDLRGLREGRRRRRARDADARARKREIAWAPDSRRLAYVSDRDGTNHLFVYDFAHAARRRSSRPAPGGTTCRASRRTASGSRSSATRGSCA